MSGIISLDIPQDDPLNVSYHGGTIVPTTSGSSLKRDIMEYKQFLVDDKRGDTKSVTENEKLLDTLFVDYLTWQFEADKQSFSIQKRYGQWIFGFVLTIVIIGLLFSIIQFGVAIKFGLLSTLSTEFSAGLNSITVSSSVLETVTLLISIVFFYFFLQFVYKNNIRTTHVSKTIMDYRKPSTKD